MLPKSFPCNTCDRVFEDSRAQRAHMQEPWHICNLKRRMASLPPISAITYTEETATSSTLSRRKPREIVSSSITVRPLRRRQGGKDSIDNRDGLGDSIDEAAQTNCCLFCTRCSNNLETNFEHMSSKHGFYIPEIESLTSLEIMIGYLRTVITDYTECLYCGTSRQSAEGIRQHMLDKGHCMINLEREPELLDFWDFSDSDRHDDLNDEQVSTPRTRKIEMLAHKTSLQDEYMLPSGKLIGSKDKARETRRSTRRIALAVKDASGQGSAGPVTTKNNIASLDPAASTIMNSQKRPQDHTVAVRDAVALVGVSDQQLRGLITLQRITQRQETTVRASAAWADELGGTHQKHYKQKMNLRDG